VFEVAKTANGYASTPTTLVSFDGTNGGFPYGNLIADAHGDLFGATLAGGTGEWGTVFEVALPRPRKGTRPSTRLLQSGINV
jgi:hypothetical protein